MKAYEDHQLSNSFSDNSGENQYESDDCGTKAIKQLYEISPNPSDRNLNRTASKTSSHNATMKQLAYLNEKIGIGSLDGGGLIKGLSTEQFDLCISNGDEPQEHWRASFVSGGEENRQRSRAQSISQKANLYSENDTADEEDFVLIEQEIARFSDELGEKQQLPILLRQALQSRDSEAEGNELIIDEVERQISDFKKLIGFSSFLLTTSLNMKESLASQSLMIERITEQQQRAEQQIQNMEQEIKREQLVVYNLETDKEAMRQNLEDALENNYELKSLNAALKQDIQSAKTNYEKLQHSYQRRTVSTASAKSNVPPTPRRAGLEARVKELENEVKVLEKELNKKMDHIDSSNSAYDALQRELSELKVTNALYYARLTEAEELIIEQDAKLDQYDQDQMHLQQQLAKEKELSHSLQLKSNEKQVRRSLRAQALVPDITPSPQLQSKPKAVAPAVHTEPGICLTGSPVREKPQDASFENSSSSSDSLQGNRHTLNNKEQETNLIEEQLDTDGEFFNQDYNEDIISNNSMNRSYQELDEAESSPTRFEIKTPTNRDLQSSANTFFKSPLHKGSKLLLASPDQDGRSDSHLTFGDIHEWNRQTSERPLSTKAQRLIKKISFLKKYAGPSKDLDPMKQHGTESRGAELKPIKSSSRSSSNSSSKREMDFYESFSEIETFASSRKTRYQRLGSSKRGQIFPTARLISIYSGIVRRFRSSKKAGQDQSKSQAQ